MTKKEKVRKIRFVHIPKTAGTTFSDLLKREYGDQIFLFSGDVDDDIKHYRQLPSKERKNIKIVMGHAPIFTSVKEIDIIRPRITFLREPIERVKSFCQHVSEGKSPYLLKDFPPDSFNLDVFLESGNYELENLQAKFLVNYGAEDMYDKMSENEIFEKAIENLSENIDIFGITEFFDESILLMKKILLWENVPYYTKLNRKNTRKLIKFTKEHLATIKKLNSIDVEIYKYAKDKFLALKRKYIDSKSILLFKERNQKYSVLLENGKENSRKIFPIEDIKNIIRDNARIGVKAFIDYCEKKDNKEQCVELYYILRKKWGRLFYSEKYRIADTLKNLGYVSELYEIFLEIIKNADEENLLIKSLRSIESFSEKNKRKNHYGLILKFLLKKKNKQLLDIYRVASLYKKIDDFNNSMRWFRRIIKESSNKELTSGAYFHLGEIKLWQGNKNKAKEYFKRCLEFNPEHNKAKEYVKSL